MRFAATLITLMVLISSQLAYADLILSAAPREDRSEGISTYGPLAKRLSEVLGEKVIYEHPSSWAEYSSKIRNDSYDILLDGPHLISWRIKHTNFTPVARLPGYLKFNFVTLKENGHLKDGRSLQTAKVCAFATPNLTAVALLYRYATEAISPTVAPIQGDMHNIYQGLIEGKCDAAVLRDQFYNKKLTAEEKSRLKIIYTSNEFFNQGFSVGSRVNTQQRAQISRVLQEDASMKPILARFAKNAASFIPADSSDYGGSSNMLEGVVWGW